MNYNFSKWIVSCFLAIVLTMTSGCDFLEQAPEDTLTRDEYFETEADANSSIVAAYDALQVCTLDMAIYGEARADLVYTIALNDLDNVARLTSQYLDQDVIYARWNKFYTLLNRVNTVIEFVPDIVSKDYRFTQDKSDAILAEAYFLRALTYFYIVRIWGEAPLITTATSSDNVEFRIPKASQEEIWTQIEADLRLAEASIPAVRQSNDHTRGRATKGAVNALQADVYLWRGKFQESADAAKKVIDNESLYRLVPGSQWINMFIEKNSTEGIFEVQFNGLQSEGGYNYSGNFIINPLLIEDYTAVSDAVRGANATYRLSSGYQIWKWVAGDASGTITRPRSDANWIVYRLADVMLMRAEALNHLGAPGNTANKQAAIDLINTIRNRANIAPTDLDENSSTENIDDAILHERKLELAYEGKRWFDLLRVATRDNRPEVLIDNVVRGHLLSNQTLIRARIVDPRSWYMPIYRLELSSNQNLTQNPYYL